MIDAGSGGPQEGRDVREVDVVAVGASAGGVVALQDLVAGLRPDTSVAMLVVLHVSAASTSVLPDILRRHTPLDVVAATDGAPLARGRIYVAPPDHHLVLDGATVRLTRSAKVNGHRPAIDLTFESAAATFGQRVLGILLSGMLDDGVLGLGAIRQGGGATAVQHPDEAPYDSMPRAAIEAGVADEVLPVADLVALVRGPADGSGPLVPIDVVPPVDSPGGTDPDRRGTLTSITCPNCGGSLWERPLAAIDHYECRVGHRYSAKALFDLQTDALDDALWAAHRALIERSDLARRMAERLRRRGHPGAALRYDRRRDEADGRAAILHEALVMSKGVDAVEEERDDAVTVVDGPVDGVAR